MFQKIVCAIMLILLLASILALLSNIQPVKAWTGVITIYPDGNVLPMDAPVYTADNVTYALTDDVFYDHTGALYIYRDNIVVDGMGHTVEGLGGGKGVHINGLNVTIKKANIKNWLFGVVCSGSYNTISENNLTLITRDGIYVSGSFNVIEGNTIEGAPGDSYGIQLSDEQSNTTISHNRISGFWYGICLTYSSSFNVIEENYLSDNTWGIGTREPGASHNLIRRNTVTRNFGGIDLYNSANYNIVTENNVSANAPVINRGDGITCRTESNNNIISKNEIRANAGRGLSLQSQNNSVYENMIQSNRYGVWVNSPNNFICHNNLANNTEQVHDLAWDYGLPPSVNIWDDGYPSGGNSWSDYNGTDLFKGSFQNETGSDGIGDTPYFIDINNTDHYPFTDPWQSPDIAIVNVTTSKMGCVPFPTVCQNCTLSINLRIENQGSYSETFNVTVYANDTEIRVYENAILFLRSSMILDFVWDTTGFGRGNYTISAVLSPVSGEVNTENNEFHDCWILITSAGDINADQVVDIFDCASVALAFSSTPSDPNWSPNADINNDGIVDIFDIVVVALHFGETG